MKIIKYKLMTESNRGTEEEPKNTRKFLNKQIICTADNLAKNEEIAKAEAYNGEYIVEDVPDKNEPTE